MSRPRAIVTSTALRTAIGCRLDDVWDACLASRSGLAAPSLDVPFATVVGEVREALPPLDSVHRAYESRVSRMANALASDVAPAVRRLGARAPRERIGLVLGSSTGGLERSERQIAALVRTGRGQPDYDFERQHAMHGVLDLLARVLDVRGPRYVVSTACSSGAKAFAIGRRMIRAGLCDGVVVGGIDGLCETTIRGFHALGVLAPSPSRPFSAERCGMNVGEGGALALLEADGDGPVELLGAGESTDAYHVSAPDPDGRGAALAIRHALADAGLDASAIAHVNAHGTGTKQNDAAEARAVAAVLGAHVPVTSTKPLTGHLLGAAGAVEAIIAALSIEHGAVPATLGALPRDESLGIAVATRTILAPQRYVLSTSLAFGGSNVALILGRAS